MHQEMPTIKLGGPQKFSHLKWWASDPPTLRTTALERSWLLALPRCFVWESDFLLSRA